MKKQLSVLVLALAVWLLLFIVGLMNANKAWAQWGAELNDSNQAWGQWATQEAETQEYNNNILEVERLALDEELENSLAEIDALNDQATEAREIRDEMAAALTVAGICNENFVLGIGEGTVQFWTDADKQLPKCPGWYNISSADEILKDYFNGVNFCKTNPDHWIPADPFFTRYSYFTLVEGDSITEWASKGAFVMVGGDYLEPPPDNCLLP